MNHSFPSLIDYLKTRCKLNSDQLKCIQEIQNFLESDIPCFILKGYAGTGKTFLTRCLADYFKSINWETRLMAPTGRAARILATKTKMDAYTIHKSIYNLADLDEVITIKNGKEKYKFRFGLTSDISNVNTAVIVDESSMISDVEQEGDFFVFGSGRLLKDVITLFAPGNKQRNIKIVFIGDDAQLPPVSDNLSGALSKEYLKKTFDIDVKEYQLTEVVRQEGESEILKVSNYLRNQLLDKGRSTFKFPDTSRDVHYLDTEKAIAKYLETVSSNGLDSCIMINFKNKDAFDVNTVIRENLFPGKGDPQVGDILIINQNNYNHGVELLNGTFVKVKKVFDDQVIRSGIPSYTAKGEDVKVTLVYRKLTIEVPIEIGVVDLDCFVLESFLNDPEAQLSYEDNIASYIDFKIRHPHLKPKTQEFKDALRSDGYFNAVKVKYGYSITCHKAQGGEWENVIVNMDVSQGKLSDLFLRWTYTAVTRASKSLYLYNVPSQTKYSKIVYNPIRIEDAAKQGRGGDHIQLVLSDRNKEFLIMSGLSTAPHNLKIHYYELLAQLLGSGIEIAKRESHLYQEKYTFEEGQEKAIITFWYNGKGKFTKKEKTLGVKQNEELVSRVISLSDVPINFTLNEDEANVGDELESADHVSQDRLERIAFPDDLKCLENLYVDLLEIVERKGIHINNIVHNYYQERYFFIRGDEKACLNFTYDSKNNFTWATGVAKECNSQALLGDLENSIAELKNL